MLSFQINQLLKEKIGDNESLKSNISRLEIELKSRIDLEKDKRECETRIRELIKEVEKNKSLLTAKMQEIDSLKIRQSQQDANMKELILNVKEKEEKLNLAEADIRKISMILRAKSEENDAILMKLKQAQGEVSEMNQMRAEREDMIQEIKKLREIIDLIHKEKDEFRLRNLSLEEENKLLNQNLMKAGSIQKVPPISNNPGETAQIRVIF